MNGFQLTWLAAGVVLALFAARAWVVESRRDRLSTPGTAQRVLTGAVALSVVGLAVLLTLNGGLTLVDLIVNGEPELGTPSDVSPIAGLPPGDPAADPAAPIAPPAPADGS
ncbi:hypothetical protein WIS52_24630 [Pseudonocardia nematodicida]|uniref:Uncharacterized protein n=1 Tax=Pseudonocardia nematodicida TaxID=1206997 RepID=A0ABV1KHK6_9PSEU